MVEFEFQRTGRSVSLIAGPPLFRARALRWDPGPSEVLFLAEGAAAQLLGGLPRVAPALKRRSAALREGLEVVLRRAVAQARAAGASPGTKRPAPPRAFP